MTRAINIPIKTTGAGKSSSDLKKVDRSLDKLSTSAKNTSTAFSGLGKAVGVTAVAFAGFRLLKDFTANAVAAETATAALEAVLKSTGEVAGVTKDAVLNLSGELQGLTAVSDDLITEGQALMLTFTSISKDVFPDAITTALDMSRAFGSDLKGSVIQLGKALNDPILGISALARVGVAFTQTQKDMIRVLQESGDIMGAQKIILAELKKEVGGAALAYSQTLGGALEKVKLAWDDFSQAIGEEFADSLKANANAMTDLLETLTGFAPQIATTIGLLGQFTIAVGLAWGAVKGFNLGFKVFNSVMAKWVALAVPVKASIAEVLIKYNTLTSATKKSAFAQDLVNARNTFGIKTTRRMAMAQQSLSFGQNEVTRGLRRWHKATELTMRSKRDLRKALLSLTTSIRKFMSSGPAIIVVLALVAVAAYNLYKRFNQSKEALKDFREELERLQELKGLNLDGTIKQLTKMEQVVKRFPTGYGAQLQGLLNVQEKITSKLSEDFLKAPENFKRMKEALGVSLSRGQKDYFENVKLIGVAEIGYAKELETVRAENAKAEEDRQKAVAILAKRRNLRTGEVPDIFIKSADPIIIEELKANLEEAQQVMQAYRDAITPIVSSFTSAFASSLFPDLSGLRESLSDAKDELKQLQDEGADNDGISRAAERVRDLERQLNKVSSASNRFKNAWKDGLKAAGQAMVQFVAQMVAQAAILALLNLIPGFAAAAKIADNLVKVLDFKANAEGFQGTISKPTLMLIGEAGPEKVSISPQGQQQPAQGNVINININGGMIDESFVRSDLMPLIARIESTG